MMADPRVGDNVSARGVIIVAVATVLTVTAAVWLTFARDDMRSTPVEDFLAGRPVTSSTADPTDSDPGLTAENQRPQGRLAPDSAEGTGGAGSSALTRDTPALNPGVSPEAQATVTDNTGRNAPPPPFAEPRQAGPTNDLRNGANADPAESREVR
jgi:hypothetical protein